MADNPIKYSDFIQPDGSIKTLIGQLEELQLTYLTMLEEVKKDATALQKVLKSVDGATESNRKTTRKAATDADKLAQQQEKLKQAQSDTGKELAKLRAEQTKQNQINKLQAKLNDSLEGSYDKLSAQYSLNKIALNAMSKAERDNTKAGKELEKQTAQIYEEMKRLQEATGKHTLSVGDYTKGWRGLKDELGQVPGATGAVVGGFDQMSASAKAFLANPLVLTISLIVGGLYALFSAFKKTKAGSDLLAKGSAALEGVMSAIVGIVDTLYKSLVSLFDDPQAAMEKYWEALKKNIVNRFEGLVNLLKSVGSGLKALWQRDLSGIKNAAKDAGTALIQMNTGLDEKQQKDFADSVAETTKRIKEQALAFAALEEARRNTRRGNRELEKSVEELITQEELLKAIADDNTKSFAEREEAAEQAAQLTIKRANLQQQIARNNLGIINQELALRKQNGEDVEDLLDQQLDAYKTLKQAQRDYLLSVRDNQKRESELVQDRLERDLDILIDGFDNQKAINERLIADESKSFEFRQAKLNETQALFEASFQKQIETIQKFTDVQIDSNALISESDAVVLNEKIRALGLSEIIEGRLLEIVRERRTATQDLAEAQKDLADEQFKAQKKALDKEIALNKEKYDRLEALDAGFVDFVLNNTHLKLDDLKDLSDKEIEALKETYAKKMELERGFQNNLRNLVGSGLDAILTMRTQSVDKEIEKTNQFYEAQLENENLSDEQRDALEKQREKKEEELQKKKEKRERQNFLIKQGFALGEIAIEAAKGVVAATAQAPATSGASLSWIPLIIGSAAAQAGIVIAQTIPQLWTGGEVTEGGKYMVNDDPLGVKGSNFREVIEKPGGKLEFPKGRNKVVDLPKGTKVHPTYDAFMSSRNMFDLENILAANGILLSEEHRQTDEIREMHKSIKRMGDRFEKVASRPIRVNNTIKIDDKRPYY